jgi:O-antigen/teichoic acid export membrane protein
LSSIKKLAGQTVWYGASSIGARFLFYMLTPYLTKKFTSTPEYGEMTLVYSLIPFLNTVVLFGFETAYFRYVQMKKHETEVFNTLTSSLILSTFVITLLMILTRAQVAHFIGVDAHPEYIVFSALIIACDALSAIPFVKLRFEGRPRKFAFIRIGGILINIAVVYFFLSLCPMLRRKHPDSIFLLIYSAGFGVGYVLLANLAQAFFQVVALGKELLQFRWHFNVPLWKEIVIYSLPLTIAGFAGMVNETADRIMLKWWGPYSTVEDQVYHVGVYGACYKLSILITLFVQAFRMGAEPFFFRQSTTENAPATYARVTKFFVITICLMFLTVSLYLNIWKYFIQDKRMWSGLRVVPILLFANMFLGIYINLSIWYKLSRKTSPGAYITLVGAAITLVINYVFIPRYSYMACAWATFLCYGSMMLMSFLWGQRQYPIPYATKKLTAYLLIVAALYLVHHELTGVWKNEWFSLGLATVFTLGFALFILRIEKKEFQKLPYLGKLIDRLT